MSIFFVNERRPKVTVTPPTPDLDAALDAVSRRSDPHTVSVLGSITVEQARELAAKCRHVEPLLLAAIQDGKVTTQTSAATFLRDNTDGFFPAAKFIQRLKEVVGSDASPATWAQVVAAAQTEVAG